MREGCALKILIAYAGKTGGSAEMCGLLATLLPNHTVVLADLTAGDTPSLDVDYVVLGGAVRFGRLMPAARRFIRENEGKLTALPHSLFLCCAFHEQFENYMDRVFPTGLVESAEKTVYFGGELNLSKQKGFDKLLVRMVRSSIMASEEKDAALPGLLPEHVRLLADYLRPRS